MDFSREKQRRLAHGGLRRNPYTEAQFPDKVPSSLFGALLLDHSGGRTPASQRRWFTPAYYIPIFYFYSLALLLLEAEDGPLVR